MLKLSLVLLVIIIFVFFIYFKKQGGTFVSKVQSHEDAFKLAATELQKEFNITSEELKKTYKVSVIKYLDSIDSSSHMLDDQGEEIPTSPGDRIEYTVSMNASLLIFSGKETLFSEIGIEVTKNGKIGSMDMMESKDHEDDMLEGKPMHLDAEKVKIKNLMDSVLIKNIKKDLLSLASQDEKNPLMVIDQGEEVVVTRTNGINAEFRYIYNKNNNSFNAEDVEFINVSPEPEPFSNDQIKVKTEIKLISDPYN